MEPRIQREISELDSAFKAFAATRSQRAAADKKAGGEATANEPSGRTPNAKPPSGSRLSGKKSHAGGAPGTSALKGTRGGGSKKRPKRRTTLSAFPTNSWSATGRRIHSFLATR